MNRRLLAAIAGVAVLGGGIAGAAIVASPGGDEELVQQVQTPTPTPSATPAVTFGPVPTVPQNCPPALADERPYAPPSPATTVYQNREFGFSLDYPVNWSVCIVLPDPSVRDFLTGVKFVDENGLPRASVSIFANTSGATLEGWIMDHNPIFFDYPPEERTVAGARALYSSASSEGIPVGHAYVDKGALIFDIGGLKPEDFELIVKRFQFPGS